MFLPQPFKDFSFLITQLRFLNYDYQFLLKKRINTTPHSFNIKIWIKKNPHVTMCEPWIIIQQIIKL
jgi:hypothetical protein